jgi:heme-degrading monooxygenase HmoA
MYVVLWEYHIRQEFKQEFEHTYGPEGTWVHFFKQAEGYLRTELLHDTEHPGRYMTIDYWNSGEMYNTFNQKFREEYEKIDRQCERLTQKETRLGSFLLSE